MLKNFKNFRWNSDISNCSKGKYGGSERLIEFSNGSKLNKTRKIDDNKMIIGWRVVETDNKMLL